MKKVNKSLKKRLFVVFLNIIVKQNIQKHSIMSEVDFSNNVIQYSSDLKPFAINLTQDIEDANDLLQETLYRALTNREKFREGTNLKAWLFTIMKNIFINGYRRKVKRRTIIDTTDNQYYINTSSINQATVNRSEANFMMEDIMQSIVKLQEEFRIPFLMHYKGYKYQEIAEELNLPLGTVKSRIFFARKDLKKHLAIYEKDKNSGSK